MTNSRDSFDHLPGLWNTNSYLSAGFPYITGSQMLSGTFGTNNGEVIVSFPQVTKTFTVINRSNADIRIHFNSMISGNVIPGRHYITLTEDRDSLTCNIRCRQVFITMASSSNAEFELIAELTNINQNQMIALTGTGLTI